MNKDNKFFIQIQGPFKAGETFMNEKWFSENLRQIAIQVHSENAPGLVFKNSNEVFSPRHIFRFGNEEFAIGATGILEIQELNEIYNFCKDSCFLQDEPASTIVDLVFYGSSGSNNKN